jgi:hypothetical protein
MSYNEKSDENDDESDDVDSDEADGELILLISLSLILKSNRNCTQKKIIILYKNLIVST